MGRLGATSCQHCVCFGTFERDREGRGAQGPQEGRGAFFGASRLVSANALLLVLRWRLAVARVSRGSGHRATIFVNVVVVVVVPAAIAIAVAVAVVASSIPHLLTICPLGCARPLQPGPGRLFPPLRRRLDKEGVPSRCGASCHVAIHGIAVASTRAARVRSCPWFSDRYHPSLPLGTVALPRRARLPGSQGARDGRPSTSLLLAHTCEKSPPALAR